MTELQQNRYDALLRRVGNLKGPGSKVNDVLQELFPTFDVENVPGELLFLMATKIGFASASKSATAGKKAGIQLFNPAGSGHLVTISTVLFSANADGAATMALTTTALGTNTGIPRLRDSRIGTGPSGVSQLRTSQDTTAGLSGNFRVLANTNLTLTDVNSVAVLAPGSGLTLIGQTDMGITVTFFYRERIAEPSELTF